MGDDEAAWTRAGGPGVTRRAALLRTRGSDAKILTRLARVRPAPNSLATVRGDAFTRVAGAAAPRTIVALEQYKLRPSDLGLATTFVVHSADDETECW